MTKKRKELLVALILILFLITGGISLHQHKINVQAKEAQKIETEIKKAFTTVKYNVKQLYKNDDYQLLSESISKVKITKAEDSLQVLNEFNLTKSNKIELKNYSQRLDSAKKMYAIQLSIHNKFTNEKITSDDIEFSKEEKELTSLNKTHPLFAKTITDSIEQSKSQLAVKKELNLFFEDFDKLNVKESISRSEYNKLNKKIDSLTSEPFKTSLVEALKAIQTALEDKELKEKEEQNATLEKERQESEKKDKEEAEKEKVSSTKTDASTVKKPIQDKLDTTISPEKPEQQDGIEGLIARTSTSKLTHQIISVVATGSSATVSLFEKNGEQWQTVLTVPGRVGYNGVGSAYEGSGRTPKGVYSLGFAFGTGQNPGTNLAYRQITDQSYWISNPGDAQYNTWQERSSSSSLDEHMSDYQTQYQYGITL
ncbi:MAG: hypothetical protein WBF61_02800, partial [Carnobacterium sp.]